MCVTLVRLARGVAHKGKVHFEHVPKDSVHVTSERALLHPPLGRDLSVSSNPSSGPVSLLPPLLGLFRIRPDAHPVRNKTGCTSPDNSDWYTRVRTGWMSLPTRKRLSGQGRRDDGTDEGKRRRGVTP